MHLAAGKRIFNGEFTLAASGNQTWLYDLFAYGLYRIVGGSGIVVIKALLVVALALVLSHSSKGPFGWSIPAFCVVLAVLTMSMRLLLQPATVSCLMLALCISMISRKDYRLAAFPPVPLAILMLFWANLDGWFLVGLVAVALVDLGSVLDRARTASRDENKSFLHSASRDLRLCLTSLSLLMLICLLNPVHIHAFRFSSDLVGSSSTTIAILQRSFLSGIASRAGGIAYFALLVLGVLSFFLAIPRWRWRWFLPWAGFVTLSIFEVRTIPFFAVVAGPVLAWNLQEFLAMRSREGKHVLPGSLFFRLMPVSLLVILIGLAWPGWLQAPPYEPRRWAIDTSPSLERGAETTRRWLCEGKLGLDARGLHLSPETTAAFAWYCPEENGILDADLAAAVIEERGDWSARLRNAQIDHVIVYDSDNDRLLKALDRFLAEPEQWPLLYSEGGLAVFGWRDPLKADTFHGLELDLDLLAFHPDELKKAPWNRPEHDPGSRHRWHAFWKAAPPRTLDREEATFYLLQAEALRKSAPFRHLTAWEATQASGMIASAAGSPFPVTILDGYQRLVFFEPQLPGSGVTLPLFDRLALRFQPLFTRERDDTPSAVLYLAIRAARRALAVDPDDASMYSVLGECYLRLLHNTREGEWAKKMPELAHLRHVQASAALNQAILLNPKLSLAHQNLAALYTELGYMDMALEHRRAHLKLIQGAGVPPGMAVERFHHEVGQMEQALSHMSQDLENRSNAFAEEASRLRVVDRASLALERGLAGKARDMLLESDVAAFGSQGMLLELELLLRTGRVKDVREWTSPEQKTLLGATNFHWLRAQALAASGDYALAAEECAQLASSGGELGALSLQEQLAMMIGRLILDAQPGERSIPKLLWQFYGQIESRQTLGIMAMRIRQEANASVIQGLIALEQGDVDEAKFAFRQALSIWKDLTGSASGHEFEFNGRIISQKCLLWIE